jgi:hypothetical protein
MRTVLPLSFSPSGLRGGQLGGLRLFQFGAAGSNSLIAASVARRASLVGIRKLRA